MKISVIMVDGSFREHIFGAKYFTDQDFPKNDYEVIWVEFYKNANPILDQYKKQGLQIVCLENDESTTYHSSCCFNEGIKRAKGEVLVIPDADQIVEANFIQKVWDLHQENENQFIYGYRYDEIVPKSIQTFELQEVKEKTRLKNLFNYGGCLTVHKKWLLQINGYEEHWFFSTGFHANGTDIYHRLKNIGLAMRWAEELKLYHPWHAFSQIPLKEKKHYALQFELINWRARNFITQPFNGLEVVKNYTGEFPFNKEKIAEIENNVAPKATDKSNRFKTGLAIMFPKIVASVLKLKSKKK